MKILELIEKISFGMGVFGGWLSIVGFITWFFIQGLD